VRKDGAPILLELLTLSTTSSASFSAPPAPAQSRKAAAPKAVEVLPFIHDDYPKALALARARKAPLFIASWALW